MSSGIKIIYANSGLTAIVTPPPPPPSGFTTVFDIIKNPAFNPYKRPDGTVSSIGDLPDVEAWDGQATRLKEIRFVTNTNTGEVAGSVRQALRAAGDAYIIPLVWGYYNFTNTGLVDATGRKFWCGFINFHNHKGLVFRRDPNNSGTTAGAAHGIFILGNSPTSFLGYNMKVYRGIANADLGYPLESGSDFLWQAANCKIAFVHCTAAFSSDETFGGTSSDRFLMQDCWALMGVHDTRESGGGEAKGTLFMGSMGPTTLVRSLNAFVAQRLPWSKINGTVGTSYTNVANCLVMRTNSAVRFSDPDSTSSSNNWATAANYWDCWIENDNRLWTSSSYTQRLMLITRTSNVVPERTAKVYMNGVQGRFWNNSGTLTSYSDWQSGSVTYSNSTSEAQVRVNTPFPVQETRRSDAASAKARVLSSSGASFAFNPITREVYNMRDDYMLNVRNWLENGLIPVQNNGITQNSSLIGAGAVNNYMPSVPSGSMTEQQFIDIFNAWGVQYGITWANRFQASPYTFTNRSGQTITLDWIDCFLADCRVVPLNLSSL